MSRFTLFLVIVLVGLLVIAGAFLLTRSDPLSFPNKQEPDAQVGRLKGIVK